MTDPGGSNPGLAELSRLVRDVLQRFEGLATKLETQFINKDVFKLYSDGITREIEHLLSRVIAAESTWSKNLDASVAAERERNDQLDKRNAQLEKRVELLEGNIRWVVRLVIAAVIAFVLAAVGLNAKAGGGG